MKLEKKKVSQNESITTNPSKLHEVFITIFTNLEQKIKQLNKKLSHLYNSIDLKERRVGKIENANYKLRDEIQKFRDKIDKQDRDIQNLTFICYIICGLLVVLILLLCLIF